jgi:uncharacterized protein
LVFPTRRPGAPTSGTAQEGRACLDRPLMSSSSSAKKSKRGFASMDRETQKIIASKGGKAAHEKGAAHEFTREEAREAGTKGGNAVAKDRAHMAEIGRRGGLARQRRREKAAREAG